MSKVENAMWWAGCDDCGVLTSIDGDGNEVPDPGEWDQFPTCLVCGGTLYFDSSAETHWQRESRLMQAAIEAAAS